MYRLLEYLEKKNKKGTLNIFDIDDTLFRTAANVMVVGPSGIKTLTASEFNSYRLAEGERYDFGQFQDAQLFKDTSTPIETVWRAAKNILENIGKRPGSRVVVVTARSDLDNKDVFLETFEKHGMDMSKVHVFRAGNLNEGNSANNKKVIIRRLLETGHFNESRLFDDHHGNLQAFLELKQEFPGVIFKAFPITKSGNIGKPIIV